MWVMGWTLERVWRLLGIALSKGWGRVVLPLSPPQTLRGRTSDGWTDGQMCRRGWVARARPGREGEEEGASPFRQPWARPLASTEGGRMSNASRKPGGLWFPHRCHPRPSRGHLSSAAQALPPSPQTQRLERSTRGRQGPGRPAGPELACPMPGCCGLASAYQDPGLVKGWRAG